MLQNAESKYVPIPILQYMHNRHSSNCKQYNPASGVDDEEIPHRLWSFITAPGKTITTGEYFEFLHKFQAVTLQLFRIHFNIILPSTFVT